MGENLQRMENIHILIADRDDNLRSALKLLIRNDHHDISIDEAASMESVRLLMDSKAYNIAILDWNIHRNRTHEFINELRRLHPNTITIVLSRRIEDKAAALKTGVNAFVYKGDPPELLHNTLRIYLAKASEKINKNTTVLPSCPKPIYCHYLI